MTSVVENVVGLHHPWTLSPKVIQRLSSSCCGLQVFAAADDVADRKIKVLLMMLLKVLLMMMMMIAD